LTPALAEADAARPWVRLAPGRRLGRLVDPVLAEAAALMPPGEALRCGVLPFGLAGGELLVAVAWPPGPGAAAALESLPEPTRVFWTTPGELAAAAARLAARTLPFGEWAVRLRRVHPAAVVAARVRQRRSGGRIGDLLVTAGAMSDRARAEVVARQAGCSSVVLGGVRTLPGLDILSVVAEQQWRRAGAVPFGSCGRRLYVAAEDPPRALRLLSAPARRRGFEVQVFACAAHDVRRQLEAAFRHEYLRRSRDDLGREHPEDSARVLLTWRQAAFATIGAVALLLFLWRDPRAALLATSVLVQVVYLWLLAFKVHLVRKPAREGVELRFGGEEIARLDEAELPVYTILVPLRDEAQVLENLVASLLRLDYPRDRLDIKLLLEQDDAATIGAARALDLPPCFELLVLPPAAPHTKPKACNYGLLHARGDYAVIYDAEDAPDPDQLKKAVLAFRTASPEVACVQAKLSYYNRAQNGLTRWFTAEYAMWFDLLLPGLQAAGMPIPLGGTSNHLRVEALRRVGAWDPYNVTEDADLGVRLHKAGYRTLLMDSDTYEEANAEFVNWVRQRSRWIKGYLQTWLVHMRHPLALWRAVGTRGFLGLQAMILGTPLTLLLNPLLWMLTTAWFLTAAGAVQAMFPQWVYYAGMLSMLLGNFAFAYLNMLALARRGWWDLMDSALSAPAYWALMSIAAWKALWQLTTRPSHWEKTAHGLSAQAFGDLRGVAD